MNSISMDYFEYSQSSSSSLLTPTRPKHKKKAGRKVFKETRHPVYRGVRRKNGGKWVCEVREPNTKSRIWLGTFPDPEKAAVAHDVAALALRGDLAPLNFPDSLGHLPRPRSSSHQDIQKAALRAATDLSPSLRFLQENNDRVENSCSGSSSLTVFVDRRNDFERELMGDSPVEERDAEGGEAGVAAGLVDEEEVFNMPVLLDSMAEGMLLTPLAMKKGFSWSQYEVDDDGGLELNLWGDYYLNN